MSVDERKVDAAMERYADGDDAAFGEIYDSLAPKLRRFLRRSIREHVEDLVQQTFCQVHLARGSFIRGAHVRPWVFAIARRLLIDRLRRAKHEAAARAEQPLWAPLRVHGPDEALCATETATQLSETLGSIPAGQREALVLLRGEGLSVREAAVVLGTTAAAVKLRAGRALQALRRALEGGRSLGRRKRSTTRPKSGGMEP
jgi:RNA polymerase sigma-70 factor (ECF subfamily)